MDDNLKLAILDHVGEGCTRDQLFGRVMVIPVTDLMLGAQPEFDELVQQLLDDGTLALNEDGPARIFDKRSLEGDPLGNDQTTCSPILEHSKPRIKRNHK